MTTLQFSLFFVALLIGYLLVHVRLAKFETYLKEIVGLKQLNDRLKGVADAMERIRVERLEEGLQLLHEDAQELVERLSRIEKGTGPAGFGDRTQADGGGELSPAERICAAVEERLFQLGYQKLRILTDLRNLRIEDEVEVLVECERRMMPCKGRVVARNGAILDVDVHTVVQMFP